MGDLAASGNHNVLYRADFVANPAEKLRGVARRGDQGDNIPVGENKVSVGNICLLPALHRADQHITAQLGNDVPHGFSDQRTALRQTKLEQLDPSLGKSVNFNRGREAQDARDLCCCRLLRVDHHGKSQLFLQEPDVVPILRLFDAGDGFAPAFLVRDEAA